MPLKLEHRRQPSLAMTVASPVIAATLTALFGAVLFPLFGIPLVGTAHAFFVEPISSVNGLSELLLRATPIVIIALGLSIGFKANVWNIGAEGQLYIGAICGAGLALFSGLSGPLLIPSVLLLGILGGIAWAAIPALLKTRFAANEILVSLMLNYVAALLLVYLVNGPWKDPTAFNFPQSSLLPADAMLPGLVEGQRLNISVCFAIALLIAVWILNRTTFTSFRLMVGGAQPAAARYAGFNANQAVWIGMLAGGGAAGLAGICEVAGPLGQLLPTVSPGFGLTAIIVAFVGRLHPVGIGLTGLLIALLHLGADTAQVTMQVPSSVASLFQGILLLFLIGMDLLINYRVRFLSSVTPRLSEERA